MNKPIRPLRTDGEVTRARILEAAGEQFAAKGFAEATNKDIAILADVDLASINYHFVNRTMLYQSVLSEAHNRVMNYNELKKLAEKDLPAKTKLRMLIEHLVKSSKKQPKAWCLRVLAREILAPSSHIHVIFKDVALPKVLLVRKILSEITGIPTNHDALTRCMFSMGAPCLMLLVSDRSFEGSWTEVFNMPTNIVVDHLCNFTLAGLEAIGSEYKKSQEY